MITSKKKQSWYKVQIITIFLGSSYGSRGSGTRAKKKSNLPVSGLTGKLYLNHEPDMVDHPEIRTNEDFEYIVQAERDKEDNDVVMKDLTLEPTNEVQSDRFNIPESSVIAKLEESTNKSQIAGIVREVLSPESKKKNFFETAMKSVRKTFQKQEKKNKSEKTNESKYKTTKVRKNNKVININS